MEDAEVHDGLPLRPEFQGVTALDYAHGFDEVVDVLELTSRLEGRAPEIGEAADTESREAAVAGCVRNARDAYLRRQIFAGIELEPLCAQPGVTGPKLAHHVRRKNVRFRETAVACCWSSPPRRKQPPKAAAELAPAASDSGRTY